MAVFGSIFLVVGISCMFCCAWVCCRHMLLLSSSESKITKGIITGKSISSNSSADVSQPDSYYHHVSFIVSDINGTNYLISDRKISISGTEYHQTPGNLENAAPYDILYIPKKPSKMNSCAYTGQGADYCVNNESQDIKAAQCWCNMCCLGALFIVVGGVMIWTLGHNFGGIAVIITIMTMCMLLILCLCVWLCHCNRNPKKLVPMTPEEETKFNQEIDKRISNSTSNITNETTELLNDECNTDIATKSTQE